MSETIVLVPELLQVRFSGVPIVGFPDAGAIATGAKTAPEGTYTGGLNNVGVAVINGSNVRDVVLNVVPNGSAHARLQAGVTVQRTGLIHSLRITYNTSVWYSPSLIITSMGTHTINADGADVIAVALQGNFTIWTVSGFRAPVNATAEDITNAIPA